MFVAIAESVGIPMFTLLVILVTLVVFAIDKWPAGVVAMVSAIVLGIFGCVESGKVLSGWSSNLTLMIMGMMVVGSALFKTGAVLLMGKSIMKAKFASNERIVMVVIMIASGLLSAFLSNTAVVATFIPLIGAMVASSNGALKNKNLMMPLGLATAIGGALTLVGSTAQPMSQSILEQYGLPTFGMFDFVPIVLPMFIALIVYFATIGYKLMDKCFDFEDNIEHVDANALGEVKLTWRTWLSVGVLVFCVAGFVAGWGQTSTIALIGASVVMLTGCISFKDAVKGAIDWNTIFVMAFAQTIAAAMNDSGAGQLIAETTVGLVGNNLFVQTAASVIVITVLTNIMSNTATAAMMTPIYIAISAQMGVQPYTLVMAVTVAANLTAATPIGGTAITMTLPAGYRFKDFLRVGTPINIIWVLLAIVLTPLVYQFVPVG